jgi:transcriptional regulator with XRE-family HTH domain
LAARAGVAPDTLKRFEQTGQISLERLVKLAVALDAMAGFEGLFPEPVATSLNELEAITTARTRRRGRRRGRRAPTQDDDASA